MSRETVPRFLAKVHERLRRRNRERLGKLTNYDLYRLRPWLRFTSKGHFLSDTAPEFLIWLDGLRKREFRKAVILGNAPCLDELSKSKMEVLRAQGYLSIGLNRSIYIHETDVLIWSDLLTIDELLRRRAIKSDRVTVLHAKLERDHRLKAHEDEEFQNLHRFWQRHRTLRKWPKTKLFMFRNSAVAALHLCYRLGIRDILMVGFGFDDRSYFYAGKKASDKGYELISEDLLTRNCGGYDTQRIIREVLQSLIEEGFKISFNGPSEFLRTVEGLDAVTL